MAVDVLQRKTGRTGPTTAPVVAPRPRWIDMVKGGNTVPPVGGPGPVTPPAGPTVPATPAPQAPQATTLPYGRLASQRPVYDLNAGVESPVAYTPGPVIGPGSPAPGSGTTTPTPPATVPGAPGPTAASSYDPVAAGYARLGLAPGSLVPHTYLNPGSGYTTVGVQYAAAPTSGTPMMQNGQPVLYGPMSGADTPFPTVGTENAALWGTPVYDNTNPAVWEPAHAMGYTATGPGNVGVATGGPIGTPTTVTPPVRPAAPAASTPYTMTGTELWSQQNVVTYAQTAGLNGEQTGQLLEASRQIASAVAAGQISPQTADSVYNQVRSALSGVPTNSQTVTKNLVTSDGTPYTVVTNLDGTMQLVNGQWIPYGQNASAPGGVRITPPHVGEAGLAPQTYVIQPGDTLSGIAAQYGTTVDAIAQANGISNPNLISAGASLTIPGGAPPPPVAPPSYPATNGASASIGGGWSHWGEGTDGSSLGFGALGRVGYSGETQFPPSVEQWRPLVSQYFRPEDVNKALFVIQYESGGDPAINQYGGGPGTGLFQIEHGGYWPGRPSQEELHNPALNVQLAAQMLYGSQSF